MKPRRPAIKDSVRIRGEFAKRRSEQVAAKAARKAEAKKRKEAEEYVNRAAARVVGETDGETGA
jgi:hypothetical protein